MSQEKKVLRIITDARIQHVSDSARSHLNGCAPSDDYFVLEAQIVVDPKGIVWYGERVTTSKLIRIDIENHEFETLNSLYKVIPKRLINVYHMTDPMRNNKP